MFKTGLFEPIFRRLNSNVRAASVDLDVPPTSQPEPPRPPELDLALKYVSPVKTAWAASLPPDYYREMTSAVGELTEGWFSDLDRAEGYDVFLRDCYIYGRMDQCHSWVMPWIEAAVSDLSQKTVLEIGCGNGSSTAPMALKTRHVHAFDIDAEGLDVARKRCALLGISNVSIFHRDTSWIGAYADDPRTIYDGDVDVIYAFALLEHLMPLERITFLQAAWRYLPVGGHLILVECPNRLHWYDWHSSQMPFADTLPAELAFLYNGASKRSNIWSSVKAKDLGEVAACDREKLYRWGRGVSYHEFVLALGDRFKVTAGPASAHAIGRHDFYGVHGAEWEACLVKVLQSLDPPIAPEFAAPSLDLILTKTTP